jgi:hypothetical protein
MYLRDESGAQDGAFIFLAAIGRVRSDRAAGVSRIDQSRQFPVIVACGIAGRPSTGETVAPVDADMRLLPGNGPGDFRHWFYQIRRYMCDVYAAVVALYWMFERNTPIVRAWMARIYH